MMIDNWISLPGKGVKGDCVSYASPYQPFSTRMSQWDFHLTPLAERQVCSFNSPSTTGGDSSALSMSNSGCHKVRSQKRDAATWKNNSASAEKYACPDMPKEPCDIGVPWFVENRCAYRMTLRPDKFRYVTLNFRVMRYDTKMHVGQLINLCGIKRTELYTPRILDRWTQKLTVKLKSSVKVSVVFSAISARLGLQNMVGIRYCLDGFYGIEAFGDAFGNYGVGVCPWMEVCGEGNPISLKLEDGDNIYVSVANEKMDECARRRCERVAEQMFRNQQQRVSLLQTATALRTADANSRTLDESLGSNSKRASMG